MSQITPSARTARYHPNPDVLSTEIDDGLTVLLSLVTNYYYQLNETGSCIWGALGDGATVAHVAAALQACYDVNEGQALAYAGDFLAELIGECLIQEVGDLDPDHDH